MEWKNNVVQRIHHHELILQLDASANFYTQMMVKEIWQYHLKLNGHIPSDLFILLQVEL